jgi:hypothetical protein
MAVEVISLEELERMEKLIRILEIIFTIFKYLPHIIGVLAAMSLIFAAFNFIEKSYGWSVVNLVLGLIGVLFVIRVNRRRPEHFNEPSDLPH